MIAAAIAAPEKNGIARVIPLFEPRLPRMDTSTSDSAVTTHLAHLRALGRRPSTITKRRIHLAALQAALPVPLLDATPQHLADWRAGLTQGPEMICACVSHARGFYQWAEDEGLIERSPAARLARPRKPRRLPRPIDHADLLTALDRATGRMRTWIVLIAWCGLRCQEIAYLRGEDIHLAAHPPYLLVSSQAAKGGRERVVELCPFAAAEVRAARLPARGWAFPRRDGKPGPNAPWRVSQLINDHLRSAGVGATAHAGRHWFGTEMLEAAHGNIRVVQVAMGHGSPETTALYTLVRDPDRARAVAKLPAPRRLRAVLPQEGTWPR